MYLTREKIKHPCGEMVQSGGALGIGGRELRESGQASPEGPPPFSTLLPEDLPWGRSDQVASQLRALLWLPSASRTLSKLLSLASNVGQELCPFTPYLPTTPSSTSTLQLP